MVKMTLKKRGLKHIFGKFSGELFSGKKLGEDFLTKFRRERFDEKRAPPGIILAFLLLVFWTNPLH